MNKIEKLLLILGISTVASGLILYFANDWVLGSAGAIAVLLFSLLLFDPLDSKIEKQKEKEAEEAKSLEIEGKATTDSRIYKQPSHFLGLNLFFVLGGIGSKHESIFSIEQEGKSMLVLYHGLCLISKGDKLSLLGKSSEGKKFGLRGKLLLADRVENQSSGITFSKE